MRALIWFGETKCKRNHKILKKVKKSQIKEVHVHMIIFRKACELRII
jgi:hypothetical protein